MRSIKVGVSSRANIWIGTLPDSVFEAKGVREFRIETGSAGEEAVLRAAVEIWYPRDAAYYGLLGGTLTPGQGHATLVQVATSDQYGRGLQHPSVLSKDARVGLPPEYAEAIVGSASGTPELALLGPGVLRFDCAAHDVVGSAPMVFGRLTTFILRIMASKATESLTEEELASLLR